MKRCLFIIPIFFIIQSHAQAPIPTTKAISFGFELAAPSNSVYTIGTGVSAKFEVPVVSVLSLSLTGGFTAMYYKGNLFNSSRTPGAAGFLPLKAGIKYYLSKEFYAEGEAGTAIETNYTKRDAFAFSIGPGFIIPLNDEKHGIDIGFRYESWSSQVRQTGIRVAYRFGL